MEAAKHFLTSYVFSRNATRNIRKEGFLDIHESETEFGRIVFEDYVMGSMDFTEFLTKNGKLFHQITYGSHWIKDKREARAFMQKKVRYMDWLFAHVPPTTEDITVYRAVRVKNLGHLRPNLSYTSTTLVFEQAQMFADEGGCCILCITVPRGSRVLPILDNDTVNEGFQEVLLNRNTQFKVDVSSRFKIVYTQHSEYDGEDYDVEQIGYIATYAPL